MKKILIGLLITALLVSGCAGAPAPVVSVPTNDGAQKTPTTSSSSTVSNPELSTGGAQSTTVIASTTSRDNTPVCLETTTPGTRVDGNDYATVDYSNAEEGYICVNYLGSCSKVKLQLTGPNGVTYTYNLRNGYAAFPLTSGDGTYDISVCENIEGTKYSLSFKTKITVSGVSEFNPYLYPNQYVYFDSSKKTVIKGANLAAYCETDLDVVTSIYNYITQNISYDYDKAQSVASGYISDIDSILLSGTGICLDYASVMTSMLRSQRIPTRLEVGYAGDVYHAWISVYITDIGWLNGVIQFNGTSWELVDPTFGASTNEKALKEYIGDGTNYSTKYIY